MALVLVDPLPYVVPLLTQTDVVFQDAKITLIVVVGQIIALFHVLVEKRLDLDAGVTLEEVLSGNQDQKKKDANVVDVVLAHV
jgi:hypothetical protein